MRIWPGALVLSIAMQASAQEPSAEPRRDPKGIKGISPFREALSRGDAAFAGKDVEAAIVAYKDALLKEPQNALGHYRLGEAQLSKGDLTLAELAFTDGLRFVPASAPALKAKLLFALADLRERAKGYDEALAKWNDYEATTRAPQETTGFPATATERKKVIETWKKLSADAAQVKLRIEKGVKDADDAMRKSSK